jgi:hypothetical protein
MTARARRIFKPVPVLLLLVACEGRTPSPATPSAPSSFLTGNWTGTVTIQVNPGDPGALPPTTGQITFTFDIVPQTNLQTFRTTIRSQHAWLPVTTTASTALTPGNTPPANISTQGDYDSPRGCRGTLGSVGTADATRIDADFTGVDCNGATFSGRVALTKN